MTGTKVTQFRQTVLDNYRLHGRMFPWRETTDPYEILVSEIMLQQTQTDRTVAKYGEWLESFPDMKTLADAPLSLVLARWNGLGYNRRARFLQETCRIIAHERSCTFPETAAELDALPGIGPYTARAVMTFAFGKPEVFIETNIRSVFLFFFFKSRLDDSAAAPEPVHDSEILPLIEQTLDTDNPRVWYYALMDYGAALKKAVTNPNRKSAHYTKQSAFEGSLRQARGAIIRSLSRGSQFAEQTADLEWRGVPAAHSGFATLCEIADSEDIDLYRIEKAAAALIAERLIAQEGDVYRS
jgi:A/G-specific adenine glycosylase